MIDSLGATLVSVVQRQASRHAGRALFTFLHDDGKQTDLSYEQLERRARALAVQLATVVRPGERAILVYPTGVDFIVAFFGAAFAGVVAVPVFPPSLARITRDIPRLAEIVRAARPAAILTSEAIRAQIELPLRQLPELGPIFASPRWIATDRLPDDGADRWRAPRLTGGDLAMLQFTSGSTAAPRGVMARHENLLANMAAIHRSFDLHSESICVSWLPLYHDMGLIGVVLGLLHCGGRSVLMSPLAFLKEPFRWLDAITRFRGTIVGAPNFAYDLCVDRIAVEQRDRLDLSCLDCAVNGAEPVRFETLRRFAQAFAGSGFSSRAFRPSYGLAESMVLVTGAKPADRVCRTFDACATSLERGVVRAANPGAPARRLVSCGRAIETTEVRIVDPATHQPCRDGELGEIWIAGPSVAAGYYDAPDATPDATREATREATIDAFGAELPGGPRGFLRSGDLGFLRDDELYVTGRIKDLVIVHGRNLYPWDIETTVERCPGVRRNAVAAFAVERDGTEQLVVVLEIDQSGSAIMPAALAQIVEDVRTAVAMDHDCATHEVVVLAPRGLPRTSSGKVQRRLCRTEYLEGKLDRVAGGIRR
jgi:acyl-CoA synthetase (AMP-forming)/AMP-acid ligase II